MEYQEIYNLLSNSFGKKKKKDLYTHFAHKHTYAYSYICIRLPIYIYANAKWAKNSQIMWVYGFIVPFSAHVKIVISCKTERSK